MERTKVATQEVKPRWKKIGGGSFKFGNRLIKKGEEFSATLDEIPKAFRDTIIQLDGVPATKVPEPVLPSIPSVYTLQSRNGSSWYDVVDNQGKVVNEKAMQKAAAEKLLAELQ